MTATTNLDTTPPRAPDAVRVRAHHDVVRKLGHWTASRRFDVLASRSSILLDLRSPRIELGDLAVRLDVDHTTLTLLVPDDAIVEHDEMRRVGRGRVRDWTATGAPGGRRIQLLGEMRRSEVRVRRSGMAILSALFTREYLADCRQAWREGRVPTLHDPARHA